MSGRRRGPNCEGGEETMYSLSARNFSCPRIHVLVSARVKYECFCGIFSISRVEP